MARKKACLFFHIFRCISGSLKIGRFLAWRPKPVYGKRTVPGHIPGFRKRSNFHFLRKQQKTPFLVICARNGGLFLNMVISGAFLEIRIFSRQNRRGQISEKNSKNVLFAFTRNRALIVQQNWGVDQEKARFSVKSPNTCFLRHRSEFGDLEQIFTKFAFFLIFFVKKTKKTFFFIKKDFFL